MCVCLCLYFCVKCARIRRCSGSRRLFACLFDVLQRSVHARVDANGNLLLEKAAGMCTSNDIYEVLKT